MAMIKVLMMRTMIKFHCDNWLFWNQFWSMLIIFCRPDFNFDQCQCWSMFAGLTSRWSGLDWGLLEREWSRTSLTIWSGQHRCQHRQHPHHCHHCHHGHHCHDHNCYHHHDCCHWLFSMMETYANNLEAIVDDRTRQVIGKIFEIIVIVSVSIKIITIVILFHQ